MAGIKYYDENEQEWKHLIRGPKGEKGDPGSGDVSGPTSSTDNAIVRYDGTTGKLIQNSSATVKDNGEIRGVVLVSTNFIITNRIDEFSLGNGVEIDGVLLKDGEVDGRDVSADGTKLDGIEAGAEVNTINGDGIAKVTVSSTEPTSPSEGDIWIDTT